MIKTLFSRILSSSQKRSYASVKWSRIPFQYDYKGVDDTKITTLPSGLRVVTQKVPGPTATVGFFIDSGSRAETEANNGVAHFFEHMAFKGTSKMSQFQMETLVENMGTRLFAYTSREQTVYYGKCFGQDGERVVEILGDIIQRPLLSEQAIERERGVILREMEDIETQIDEVLFDHLHASAYQGTPLGFTILGSSNNVKTISRNDLVDYIKKHYTASRIVLVAVGDVDHDKYVQLAKTHLAHIPPTDADYQVKWYTPASYLGSSALFRNDDMPYAHVAFGYEGVAPTNPDFIPLLLASTFIGSWDQSLTNGKLMPSFLAQYVSENDNIRAYSSYNACYKDTGLWGVYFTGKKTQLSHFCATLTQQYKKLQNDLSDGAVEQARNALKTNYLMQLDGTTPLFEEIGRQILAFNRRVKNEEIEADIDRCTTEVVERAMSRMISGNCPVIVAIGPIEDLPNYMSLRYDATTYLS